MFMLKMGSLGMVGRKKGNTRFQDQPWNSFVCTDVKAPDLSTCQFLHLKTESDL